MIRKSKINDPNTKKDHPFTRLASCVLAFTLTIATSIPVVANPTGGVVVGGHASIEQVSPSRINVVQQTDRTSIDWRNFSIGRGEHVDFQQPSRSAIALNRVIGPEASRIQGKLTANGHVFLTNGNGIVFTKNAMVDVAGLVATTSSVSTGDFMAGRYQFNGSGNGSVINEGRITAAEGGLVALVSPTVRNDGLIQARLGKVALAGGNAFTLDLVGDELVRLTVTDKLAQSLIEQSGTISADGGIVVLSANVAKGVVDNVINMDGIIQARSVSQQNGKIVLHGGNGAINVAGTLDASSADINGGQIEVLGEQIALRSSASLNASGSSGGGTVFVGGDFQGKGSKQRARNTTIETGANIKVDATGNGDGGMIVVWSDNQTEVDGNLSARGGPNGGDGGLIETSSAGNLQFSQSADVSAPQGQGGEWLLDPEDITIGSGEAQAIETTLNNGGNVSIQTADSGSGEGNINVNASITKTEGPDASLALTAHNDINVNAPISSTENKLHVGLTAGHAVNVNASVSTNGGNFSTHVTGITPIESDSNTDDTSDESSDSNETDTGASAEAGAEALANNDETGSNESSSGTSKTEEQRLAEIGEQAIDLVRTVADSTSASEPGNDSGQVSNPVNAPTAAMDTGSTSAAAVVDTPSVVGTTNANIDTTNTNSNIASSVPTNTIASVLPGINVQANIITVGGNVTVNAGDSGTSTIAATVDASNTEDGQIGGNIHMLGQHVQVKDGSTIDASGDSGGGEILIGGDYQGQGVVITADSTAVDEGATIISNAIASGDGGTVIVWSDDSTTFKGQINARGGAHSGDGGFVEVSGKNDLVFAGNVDTSAANGNMGTLLLDPDTLTLIDATRAQEEALNMANTISWGRVQGLGDTSIRIQADNNITIESFKDGGVSTLGAPDGVNGGRTVTLPQENGRVVTLNSLNGSIIFENVTDNLATMGGDFDIISGDESLLGNLYSYGGDVTLESGGDLSVGEINTRFDPGRHVEIPLVFAELTGDSYRVFALPLDDASISQTTDLNGNTSSIVTVLSNNNLGVSEAIPFLELAQNGIDAIPNPDPGNLNPFMSDFARGGSISLSSGSNITIIGDVKTATGNFRALANETFSANMIDTEANLFHFFDSRRGLDEEIKALNTATDPDLNVIEAEIISFGEIKTGRITFIAPRQSNSVSGRVTLSENDTITIGDPRTEMDPFVTLRLVPGVNLTLIEDAISYFGVIDGTPVQTSTPVADDVLAVLNLIGGLEILNGGQGDGNGELPPQLPLNPEGDIGSVIAILPRSQNVSRGSSPVSSESELVRIDTNFEGIGTRRLLPNLQQSANTDQLVFDEDEGNSDRHCSEDDQFGWLASGAPDAFSGAQFGGASTSTFTTADANCS